MEHRIQEYMGEKGQRVSVKTIHGFCYELIQAEADNPENRYVNLSVWNEEDCRELMDDILEKWNTRPGNERQMIRNSRYFFYDVDKAKRWLLERNRYTGEAADYLAAMNAISPNPFNVDKKQGQGRRWPPAMIDSSIPWAVWTLMTYLSGHCICCRMTGAGAGGHPGSAISMWMKCRI